jgi:transposase InsO family protein
MSLAHLSLHPLGHKFILAATEYFSRWAEAVPLREVKSDNVIKFLEHNITYRFGVPHHITSDNAKAFKSRKMVKFMAKYKVQWNYSTGYYPQANGLIEAFIKTLGQILKRQFTSIIVTGIIASMKPYGHTELWFVHQLKLRHTP